MHTRRSLTLGKFMVVATTLLAAAATTLAQANSDLLILPARARVVGLGFDVQALRHVVMLSYRGNAQTESPLLHRWNAEARQWDRVTLNEFEFGQFMVEKPRYIYLIGTDADLPLAVQAGSNQGESLIRIDTLSIHEMLNVLDQTMRFTPAEWKALAARHNLELRDLNYARRRWGRFGPPGSASSVRSGLPPPEPEASDPVEDTSGEWPDPAAQEEDELKPAAPEPAIVTPALAPIPPEPLAPEPPEKGATAPAEPELPESEEAWQFERGPAESLEPEGIDSMDEQTHEPTSDIEPAQPDPDDAASSEKGASEEGYDPFAELYEAERQEDLRPEDK